MSQYPQYPNDPNQPAGGPAYGAPAVRGPRPAPADLAVKLLWGAIALFAIGAVISFSTTGSMTTAMVDAGATAEQADAAATMVKVVGGVFALLLGGLFVLLTVFIGKGANWARIVTTVLAAIGALFTLPSLTAVGSADQPLIGAIVGWVQMLLVIAAVVLLYRPDSNAWFKAR